MANSQFVKKFLVNRLRVETTAATVGGLAVLGASVVDILQRGKKKAEVKKQLAVQERQLRRQQNEEQAMRKKYENAMSFNGLVQNQFVNRIGHYKM